MKIFVLFLNLFFLLANAKAQAVIPSAEDQIKLALRAAPEDMQNGAAVYGYSPKGEFVLLRSGKNEMICLADNPKQQGISVACYHKDLEPFMKRGRELKAMGKPDSRDEEVKAGKLSMPKNPSTLYVYSAKYENNETSTGAVQDGFLRYVIYIPFATSKSTGLPLRPYKEGMPWIMDEGTPRAHIMITPAK